MPNQASNTFTSYHLTQNEEKEARNFSLLNVMFLKNQRVQIAESILNLVFTPNDIMSYTQQEAFLKGQLAVLNYLIDQKEI